MPSALVWSLHAELVPRSSAFRPGVCLAGQRSRVFSLFGVLAACVMNGLALRSGRQLQKRTAAWSLPARTFSINLVSDLFRALLLHNHMQRARRTSNF
eukprot:354430-Chlamydomonas_euryale.AAC.2